MKQKLAFSFVLVAAALFVLVIVIFRIIQVNGEEYSKTVLTQQNYSSTVLPFQRGTITDRNQTVLAASEQVYNVILDPAVINTGSEDDIDATLTALVEVFGYDRSELETILEEKAESSYVRYERYLSEEEKEAFETYEEEYESTKENTASILGVWFESEYQRVYPYSTLACTALGFSSSDSSQGNWGIEQYYNDYLTGTDGREYGYMNSDGIVERTTQEAVDGNTVVTTLDYTIQSVVEEAIADYLEDMDAENIGVLVMDPDTAEILAMATDSVYDLNNPTDLSYCYTTEEIEDMDEEETSDALNQLWRNFTISDTYEPGSTAKTFTIAAALEEGLAESGDTFVCDGGQQVADYYIECSHTHGTITLEQALGYSCNDAMMQLASKMGKHIFSSYQTLFGLGSTTGIDLPGEATGLLYSEDEMGSVDLATNAFGQNFTATMVQMAAAYCSILNGGTYYQPHIVKEILSADGEVVEEIGSTDGRQSGSTPTWESLKAGLELAVEDESGTATLTQIDGYTVGGKTGTAEKYPRGNDEYVMSFIGFTTVEDPQVLVYVVIDNPQSDDEDYSVSVKEAVRLEQKIMSSILDYMNITPDVKDETDTEEEADVEETTTAETDENGETVTAAAESDENSKSAESDESEDSGEADDGPYEDEVPEGGYMDEGDPGPPGAESESESESDEPESESTDEEDAE
ncbi:MAG: penicillin-binding protein 2 [Lachnospiraceae bacterium]|nr:penicillin-binding protein 2 [Lachnospiraceae bacterium]